MMFMAKRKGIGRSVERETKLTDWISTAMTSPASDGLRYGYDDGDNMLTKKQPWSNLFNDEAMLQVELGNLRFCGFREVVLCRAFSAPCGGGVGSCASRHRLGAVSRRWR